MQFGNDRSLDQLSDEVTEASAARAKKVWGVSFATKLVLIFGGSLIAGVAQFMTFPTDKSPPVWNIIGMAAVMVAALGGLYTAIVEKDATQELSIANRAVRSARDFSESLKDYLRQYQKLSADVRRATELYNSLKWMVEAIEQSALSSNAKIPKDQIQSLLRLADRPIKMALDFRLEEHWSLGVYRATADPLGRMELICIAQTRSTVCALDDARRWPAGVGAAGICYAGATEVVVPDLQSPALGTIHKIGELGRAHDSDRYRSIAAVPVRVGPGHQCWGAVVATSDRPNHFTNLDDDGIRPVEALRALSGAVALALAVEHSRGCAARPAQAATDVIASSQ